MIVHHFSDNVYAKETRMPANYALIQHAHKYDHLSILAQGSVELTVDGISRTLHAPQCINIEAGKHHGVKTLSEVIWYCIHSTDCTDSDKIDETVIQPMNPDEINFLKSKLGLSD